MTTAEIPPLSCPNGSEQRFVRARIGVTTRVVPALRKQPGTVAGTSVEGDDDMDDSAKIHPAVAWRQAILADGERWPLNTLHSTSRLVACALAEHVNRERQAWPGAAALARRTGLSERAVRTNLDALADAGWLDETDRGGRPGGRRTTLWTITTPEGTAWVTPERGAGVADPTPAPDDTTPEPDALTPAPAAPELEELGELERERIPGRVDPTAWAAARISLHSEEAGSVMAAAIDRHGEPAVREAMLTLSPRTFTHGSNLTAAINRTVGTKPDRPALRSVAAPPTCADCLGSGWVSDPGSSVARRCDCNPHPASRPTGEKNTG